MQTLRAPLVTFVAFLASATLGGSADDAGCGAVVNNVVKTAEELCTSTGGSWAQWGVEPGTCSNQGQGRATDAATCQCGTSAPFWSDGVGCISSCASRQDAGATPPASPPDAAISVKPTPDSAGPSGKRCGPFPGGACGASEVCNKLSCGVVLGVGAEGTCVTRPLPNKCPTTRAPVCGCDGITYGNDCMRLREGAALAHAGECDNPKCGMSGECPEGWICNIAELSTGAPLEESYCVRKPKTCPEVSVPVCGGQAPICDWKTYTNDCFRLLDGRAWVHAGSCTYDEAHLGDC